MSMGGWNHGGAKVTANVKVPDDWLDPFESQQIRIWGLERWQELKRLERQTKQTIQATTNPKI